jgi:ferrous iron transport protein A
MTLADLKPGERGRITAIAAAAPIRSRLWELGFRNGEQVELVRRAPLADPLEFRINGGHISLRRADAQAIKIDPAE